MDGRHAADPATPVTRRSRTRRRPTGPVAGDEVVYVETTHPTDRVLDVTWRLNGAQSAEPGNSRNLDLGALAPAPGTHTLSATVSDPARRLRDEDVDGRQHAADGAADVVARR